MALRSDYVVILHPMNGALEKRIAPHFELIHEIDVDFIQGDKNTMSLYYNPKPNIQRLPNFVRETPVLF